MDTSYLPKGPEYYPIAQPLLNIVIGVEPGTEHTPMRIHDRLEPLIKRLAFAHPEWMFVVGRKQMSHNEQSELVPTAQTFRVYNRADELGQIVPESYDGRFAFGYTNARIEKSRKIGRAHV